MDYLLSCGVFLIILLSLTSCSSSSASSSSSSLPEWDEEAFKQEAGQTHNLVFHKYNAKIRPPQLVVIVTMTVTLRHIRYLDLQRRELETVLDVDTEWYDSRLTWGADLVGSIIVPVGDLWAPDIVYTNGVAPSESLYPSKVRIRNEGKPNVWWRKKEVVTTSCDPVGDSDGDKVCYIDMAFMSSLEDDQVDRMFHYNDTKVKVADDFANNDWNVKASEMILHEDNVTVPVSLSVKLILSQSEASTGTFLPRQETGGNRYTTYTEQSRQENTGSACHSNSIITVVVAMVMCWCCHGGAAMLIR